MLQSRDNGMCPELVIGLIGLAVVMGAFFVFALLRWPGAWDEETADGAKPSVYGERVHYDAIIRQPYNTWSNLFAVALGLIVLVWLCGASPGRKPANPMLTATLYSALYAYALMFLGPGSMFFHASMKKWGGVLDNVSMNLYMPDSRFQGHAVWHILSATAAFIFFLYFRSES